MIITRRKLTNAIVVMTVLSWNAKIVVCYFAIAAIKKCIMEGDLLNIEDNRILRVARAKIRWKGREIRNNYAKTISNPMKQYASVVCIYATPVSRHINKCV